MKARSPYLVGVALLSAILFYMSGATGAVINPAKLAIINQNADGKGLFMLIPIVILLVISFIKKDLFLGLSYATVIGLILGVVLGNFQMGDILMVNRQHELLGILTTGTFSMTDIIISSILLFGMIAVAVESGCLDMLCEWILKKKVIQSPMGAELVLVLSIGVINILLSGCVLPTILLFSNVADQIGQSANISPNKRSYLLTGAATTVTAIIPVNSAFVMGAVTLINQINVTGYGKVAVNPFEIFASNYYCILITLVCFLWVFKREKQNNTEKVGIKGVSRNA